MLPLIWIFMFYSALPSMLISLSFFIDSFREWDIDWMRENFEQNAEVFHDVTDLFNNSIPDSLKNANTIFFTVNNKDDCIEITIVSHNVIDGKTARKEASSRKQDAEKYAEILSELGWTNARADSIRDMLQCINCDVIRTFPARNFNVEIYDTSQEDLLIFSSYLHLRDSVKSSEIGTLSKITNAKYADRFAIGTN